MDSSNNSGDRRRELYKRFYDSVGRADSDRGDAGEAYFDEDDIIEIYDYANDINDDFIKLEALFYGARMFPRSEDLRTRRDYLYYYLGNDEAVRLLLERRSHQNTLSRLLALRTRSDRHEPTHDDLEKILDNAAELDDEEVIQFVNEASTPENVGWLFDNVDKIRKKCGYLPTLYYELAGAAEDNNDYQRAIAMAEELTMLEPFNIEHWELLAEVQQADSRYAESLTSLDYALAIDPQSARSRILKATAHFNLGHDPEEAIGLLESVADSDRFDASALQTLVIMLTNERRTDEAVAQLEKYLAAHPGDPLALDCLFILDDSPSRERLEMLHDPANFNDIPVTGWVEWGLRHISAGRSNVAVEVLSEARRRGKLDGAESLLAEALYMAGRHADALTLVDGLEGAQWSPELNAVRVMALARLGRRNEALDCAFKFAGSIPDFRTTDRDQLSSVLSRNFYTAGIRIIFNNIIRALSSPDELPPDDYDPFTRSPMVNNS